MDSENLKESPKQPIPEANLDELKLKQYVQEIRDNQNLSLAVIGGFGAALVGAWVWALITYLTNFQIGWMAIGVGFLVGFTIRYLGKGIDKIFGIAGAFLALLGCVLGNLFTACIFIAKQQDIGIIDVLSYLDMDFIVEIMSITFSPMDVVFYAIAVYAGYKYSFRTISQEELSGLMR